MARICIVTASAIGSNPRVVKEADALAGEGHSVHVIAIRSLSLVDVRDDEILREAAWSCERIDLRATANRVLGKVTQTLALIVYRLSGLAVAHALSPMTGQLMRRARACRADLYIAHYDPALPAAAVAARRWSGLYAFDAEDFHPGDLAEIPENAEQNRLIASVERRFLPGCAYITAASRGIGQAYSQTYGLPEAVVVQNVFSKKLAPSGRSKRGSAEPGPTLYWFSQTIGPERGLEAAVEAVALSRTRPYLHLRGSIDPTFANTLNNQAKSLDVVDRIILHPPASPLQMEQLASAYDLGLVAETGNTRNRDIALTNKQFTYMLAGLPTVMSDTAGHRQFAAQAEGAVVLFKAGSATDLARAIDSLLGDAVALAAARAKAFALGQQRFNWEHEAKVLLACVDKALKKAS